MKVETDGKEAVVSGISLPEFRSVLRAFEDHVKSKLENPQKTDPLTNPLILQTILSDEHLDIDDLKNCALVSRFWNATAVPLIRTCHDPIDLSTIDMPKFCADIENTFLFPFTKFSVILRLEDKKHMTDVGKFFVKFGQFVTDLSITGGKQDEDDDSSDDDEFSSDDDNEENPQNIVVDNNEEHPQNIAVDNNEDNPPNIPVGNNEENPPIIPIVNGEANPPIIPIVNDEANPPNIPVSNNNVDTPPSSPFDDELMASEYARACKDILQSVPNLIELSLDGFPQFFPVTSTLVSEFFNNLVFPKVKTLSLESDVNLGPAFLQGLCTMLPNVTTLELGSLASTQDSRIIANFIGTIKGLTDFQDISPRPALFWDTLAAQKQRLTALDLCLGDSTDHDQLALKRYLMVQKGSVESIELDSEVDTKPALRMPAMGKVRSLSLIHDEDTKLEKCPYDLLALSPRQLPALKSMSACTKCFKGALQKPDCVCVYETVEKLFLKRLPMRVGSQKLVPALPQVDDFRRISSMLPNLSSLIVDNGDEPVGMHKDDLDVIFRNFQSLTTLQLHLSQDKSIEDINYVLTGIPYVYEPLVAQVMDKIEHPGFENLLAPLFCSNKAQPSLRDLKALKKLNIFFTPLGNSSTSPITEITVHLALLRMQSLTKLVLGGSVAISDKDSYKLSQRHRVVRIISFYADTKFFNVCNAAEYLPMYGHLDPFKSLLREQKRRRNLEGS